MVRFISQHFRKFWGRHLFGLYFNFTCLDCLAVLLGSLSSLVNHPNYETLTLIQNKFVIFMALFFRAENEDISEPDFSGDSTGQSVSCTFYLPPVALFPWLEAPSTFSKAKISRLNLPHSDSVWYFSVQVFNSSLF